mmetsp:Transcript_51755/g.166909  ORF Transcript_51755/g.166909 Transcript_51755/m.166909 type:complete len:354 (-) Transcript_51755:273-1334(-)
MRRSRSCGTIFWPPQESYSYYGESDDSHSPPHHGPHHGPEEEAKWVEALSSAAKQAGKVAMIPISLLGVPLSKSSALWRLVGLSHEEAVSFHRWLGILAMLLTSFHTLGYVVVWTRLSRRRGCGWCAEGRSPRRVPDLPHTAGIRGRGRGPRRRVRALVYGGGRGGAKPLVRQYAARLLWRPDVQPTLLRREQPRRPPRVGRGRADLGFVGGVRPPLAVPALHAGAPASLPLLRLHLCALVVRPLLHAPVRNLLRRRRRPPPAQHIHVRRRHRTGARQGRRHDDPPPARPRLRRRRHPHRRPRLPVPAGTQLPGNPARARQRRPAPARGSSPAVRPTRGRGRPATCARVACRK